MSEFGGLARLASAKVDTEGSDPNAQGASDARQASTLLAILGCDGTPKHTVEGSVMLWGMRA